MLCIIAKVALGRVGQVKNNNDVCLLSNIMKAVGTQLVMLKVPKKTNKKNQQHTSRFEHHKLLVI